MNKKVLKKALIYGSLIVVSLLLAFRFFFGDVSNYLHGNKGMVLFVSHYCPHCYEVKSFINKNSIYKQLPLSIKDISNQANLDEFISISRRHCQQKADNLSIPLLWTGEACYIGDETIIHFFKQVLEAK